MVNRPKSIGTFTETAVVRYLKDNGFPGAERPAQHGVLDEGDITGCGRVGFEVKGGKAAENASDLQVAAWLAEAEAERVNKRVDVCPLILKRKGKGAVNAGQWWAVLPGWSYLYLGCGNHLSPGYYRDGCAGLPAVRMTLAEVVLLLRGTGFGDPLPEDA